VNKEIMAFSVPLTMVLTPTGTFRPFLAHLLSFDAQEWPTPVRTSAIFEILPKKTALFCCDSTFDGVCGIFNSVAATFDGDIDVIRGIHIAAGKDEVREACHDNDKCADDKAHARTTARGRGRCGCVI
jgi:hypothetical protein